LSARSNHAFLALQTAATEWAKVKHSPVDAVLTMFMIVIPRDLPIARYSIRSIERCLDSRIQLAIFCNGLSPEEERDIRSWVALESTVVMTNQSRLDKELFASQIGEHVTSAPGVFEVREGVYETAGEIWSRELVRCSTPLVGLIDPDCELWGLSVLDEAISLFGDDLRLAVVASDLSPERYVFESYSQMEAKLAQTYHTWLCIYRRAALEVCHDFNYREETINEVVTKFDHGAHLQKVLLSSGWRGATLSRATSQTFLHYGAFAKNRSLGGWLLAVYRLVRIGRHNGFGHLRTVTRVPFLVPTLQTLSGVAYRILRFDRFDRERQRYTFDPPADGTRRTR
jgi:hypothetical protein